MEFVYNRIVDGGRVIGVSAFGKDITERRQAEKALVESERRLSLALEAASDGVFDWEMDTGRAYFSPRYTRCSAMPPMRSRPPLESSENWCIPRTSRLWTKFCGNTRRTGERATIWSAV